MNRATAEQLIYRYFNSWLQQDLDQFKTILHTEVVIKECNGPIYKGKNAAEMWFSSWNRNNNRVLQWDISNLFYEDKSNQAAIEWLFKCRFDEEEYSFYGSSIIRFRDNLIVSLNEYQMQIEQFYPYNM